MSHNAPHTALTTPAAAPAAHTSATDPAHLSADLARETQAAFLRTLAQWGNVRAAAQQVGVSRQHLYRMRRASAVFRELWDAALVIARPQVEEVLADRALNGVTESVFYHGEEVATRTRFDSRLLLAHLARLDRLETQAGINRAGQEFDMRLDRLLNPPVIHDWDDEDDGYDANDDLYAGESGGDDDSEDDFGEGGFDEAHLSKGGACG
ncbi:MAG: hypothetical protein U0995_07945 [Erythrobacter sp.]|nr:hypothetical protein [Erythrobacter sp.]